MIRRTASQSQKVLWHGRKTMATKGKPTAYMHEWIPDHVDMEAPMREPIVKFCKMVTSRIKYHLEVLKNLGVDIPEPSAGIAS